MKINTRAQQNIQILEVEGDIDFHSSPALRQKFLDILKNPSAQMVVDLKKVNYIDSSGLATFVEALQKIKKSTGKMVLANLAAPVQSVFEIAKLDQVFKITKSDQEALQILSH
jgi:anti-sigma B factor antagonist